MRVTHHLNDCKHTYVNTLTEAKGKKKDKLQHILKTIKSDRLMAQQVTELTVTQTKDWSSSPRTHRMGEKNSLPQLAFCMVSVSMFKHTLTHTPDLCVG